MLRILRILSHRLRALAANLEARYRREQTLRLNNALANFAF